MSMQVDPGKRYPTGESYTIVTNTTGVTFHVCDCHENRRRFATADDAERHEQAAASGFFG